MKSTRTYTDFDEFVKNEPAAVQSLIKTWAGNIEGDEDTLMTSVYNWDEKKRASFYTNAPITTMTDLIGDVREWGDGEETTDSCWIYETYSMYTDDDKFIFEVIGKSYRKDHSVCEQEMEGTLTVIDIEMRVAEKRAKKAELAQKDTIKWNEFFEGKTLDQLKEALLVFKFPTKK